MNCSVHPLLLEGSPSCPNLYANWLVILLLVTFLLVTNVLLMNLLIAMFRCPPPPPRNGRSGPRHGEGPRRAVSTPQDSCRRVRGRLCARSYTFQVVQGNADMFWKFQRYNLIVEYHGRPALAPPFILLSHLSLALQRLLGKRAGHTRERLGEPGARGGGPGPTGASPGPEPPSARWPHVQARLAHLARAQHPGAAVAPAELALPPERDLPEPLDQKILTWETVQKENFLGGEEQRRRDSEGEVLRKTAHRCGSAGWGWGAAGPAPASWVLTRR